MSLDSALAQYDALVKASGIPPADDTAPPVDYTKTKPSHSTNTGSKKATAQPADDADDWTIQPAGAANGSDKGKLTVDGCMAEFNDRYMVVQEAGNAVIYTEQQDPILGRKYFCKMTAAALRLLHLNQSVFIGNDKDGNPVYKSAAEVWLRHPDRKGFIYGVCFDPSRNSSENGVLNLWRGLAVEPRPGSWNLLRDHALNILCGGGQTKLDYLLDWTARLVQFPAERGHVAVVMRGGEGAGKGIFANALRRILGQHAMKISNGKHLTGNFNAHLRDCVFLFADEAFYAGDPSHVGVLKSLITEDSLTIEAKYVNAAETPNFLHLMMASNAAWVIPASLDARRFFMLEVSNERVGDHAYFEAIMKQMENGGYEAMLHDLQHRDLSNFNVRNFPVTEALQEQKKLSLPVPEAWWLDVLYRGYVYKSKLGLDAYFGEWHDVMTTEVLYTSYSDYAKSHGERHPMTRESFGRFMKRMRCKAERPYDAVVGEHMTDVQTPFGTTTRKAATIKGPRPPGYALGDLATARAAFLVVTGLVPEWPDDGPDDGQSG